MPIKSKAEWKFLAATNPKVLRKMQEDSPVRYKSLPERISKTSSRLLRSTKTGRRSQ